MNLVRQRILAAASLLAIIPAAHADPDVISVTTRLAYPDGRAAVDANIVTDTVDNVSHTITAKSHKPDQTGLAAFSYNGSGSDNARNQSLVVYILSPSGLGFIPQGSPDAYPTSVLAPFTTMRVHVVDSSGSPVPHVLVAPMQFLVGNDFVPWSADIPGPWRGMTDKDGWVTLKDLPQGREAKFTVLDSRIVAPGGDVDVQLPNAAVTPDVTVHTLPAGSVSGTVLYGDTQKPAIGVMVRARSVENPDNTVIGTTDKNGGYTISGLIDGPFEIETIVGAGNSQGWISHPQYVALDPGGHSTGINLALVEGSVITGKVVDKGTGKPLQYADVAAFAPGNDGVCYGSSMTGPDGLYTLRIFPCKADVFPRYWSSAVDTPSQHIDLAEGQTLRMDFQVATPNAPAVVHGIVLGPDSKPVSGAQITALDQSVPQYATSDSQGRFTLDSPGLHSNSILYARFSGPTGDLSTAAPFVFTADAQVTLNLTAGGLCTIKGQVNDSDGNPVPNATVQLSRRGVEFQYDIQDTVSNAQGQYAFAPTFGNMQYSVRASETGFGWANTRPFSAPAGQTTQAAPIALRTQDAITGGTVVDAKGTPLANVFIQEVSPSNDAHTTSDKAGHFVLTKVARGKIYAVATAPDGSTGEGSLTTARGDNVLYLTTGPN